MPLHESPLSAIRAAAITLSSGARCASKIVAMQRYAPVELGSMTSAFCASARAAANRPFLRSSLQLRMPSLMRTVVAMRCAMISARAAAVPGFPFVAVKRPEIPELPMSIICTSAVRVVPFFLKLPVTYACTCRKCASCFAC